MSDKLQQAITLIESGDKQNGRRLLAEILEAEPRNEQAWLWMSGVVTNGEQRRDCLEQVLEINPNNQSAKKGLELLQQQESQPRPIEISEQSISSVSEAQLKTTESFSPVAEPTQMEPKVESLIVLKGEERMSVRSSGTPRTTRMFAIQERLKELDALPEEEKKKKRKIAREKRQLERKKKQINLWVLFAVLLGIALVTAIVRSLGEENPLLWLFMTPEPIALVGNFASILAPLVTVAVAIERLLETAWDWIEQTTKAVSDVVTEVREAKGWIEVELLEASRAVEKAASALVGAEVTDGYMLLTLDIAERRLAKAEQRFLGWVDAPEWKAKKRALSIWIGLLIGLLIAVLGDLGMFRTIGFSTPRILDMLVTGLVIGLGPGPMHSIIGILQGGKDALDRLASTTQGEEVQEALGELEAAIRRT